MGVSDFRISGQSITNKNCHNSTTSNVIDMKLGPATKLDKKYKGTSKKLNDDVMSANWDTSLKIFQFLANLEQSGSRIAEA